MLKLAHGLCLSFFAFTSCQAQAQSGAVIEGCYEPRYQSSADTQIPPLYLTDELISSADAASIDKAIPNQQDWRRVVSPSPSQPLKSTRNLWSYRGATVHIVLTDTGYDPTVIRVSRIKNGLSGTVQRVHELNAAEPAATFTLQRRPCESFKYQLLARCSCE